MEGNVYDSANEALARYPISVKAITPVSVGHINLTLRIETEDHSQFILQRINPIFGPEVNRNLDRVVTHLERCGMLTPRLVRSRENELAVVIDDQRWRMLTFIEGRCVEAIQSNEMAHAVGGLLGRFHNALVTLDGKLEQSRPSVHDYARHQRHLREALIKHRNHQYRSDVAALAEPLLSSHQPIPTSELARSTVHGDPKISNVIFGTEDDEALCFVDLDTLGSMPLVFELGDALRSWCNMAGEDSPAAEFDGGVFAEAMVAYLAESSGLMSDADLDAIVPATLQIHYELASRFLADALEEAYFRWDHERYDSAAEHNLARAGAQIRAAESLSRQRADLEAVIAQAR